MKKYLHFVLIGVISFLIIPNMANSQTNGTLTFSYTPVAHSGSWGSKHVLAVWIQDGSGGFVKTKFRYWGNGTDDHLPTWKTNSNSNVVDATTGATLSSYVSRSFTWDGKDLNGNLMADGDYKVSIEECWSHGSSKVVKSFTFTKNGTESHVNPPDDSDFTNVSIDWIPAASGVENINEDGLLSVYPNPVNDMVNIDFKTNTKENRIIISNTLGQEIYNEIGIISGIKTINLNNLKNGIYFVSIELDNKKQTQKIILYR